MENNISKIIGEKIYQCRANAGLNQQELANKIGKSVSFVSKIESGTKNIDLQDLQLIANVFNTSINELITGNAAINVVATTSVKGNTKIKNQFQTVINNYLEEKKGLFKGSTIAELIRTHIPNNIAKLAKFDSDEIICIGSPGKGGFAEIPWIFFGDPKITTTAQSGYYLVLLFKSDMSGIYLSLNQGWTMYKDIYGTKEGLKNIKIVANKMRSLINTPLKGFNLTNINLQGTRNLAKGYEAGNIISKYYHMTNLPNDVTFINDLRYLLGIYNEIKGIIGENSYKDFVETILDNNSENDNKDEDNKKKKRTISTKKNILLQSSRAKENKITGTRAEEYVFEQEKQRLYREGRPDLAEKVVWRSNPESGVDGIEDIYSFYSDGREKYIEVKGSSQKFKDKFTFYVSSNEINYAKITGENHVLVLVDDVHLEGDNPVGNIRAEIVNAFKDFNVEIKNSEQIIEIQPDSYVCKIMIK